jgi:hypothetical protein
MRISMAQFILTCFAQEAVERGLQGVDDGQIVRVKKVKQVANEVCGGYLNVFIHGTYLLEGSECLNREFDAIRVVAMGIIETICRMETQWRMRRKH